MREKKSRRMSKQQCYCPNCGSMLSISLVKIQPNSYAKRYTSTPYGYRRNGLGIEKDEYEQLVLLTIRRLRDDGLTQTEIADELNNKGFVSRSNRRAGGRGKWTQNMVCRLLALMRKRKKHESKRDQSNC